jgi:hypothetical protein
LPDGKYFGVRCGIVARGHSIRSFGNDSAIPHDDRAERPTTSGADICDRQFNGAGHESFVHVLGSVIAESSGLLAVASRESATQIGRQGLFRSRYKTGEVKDCKYKRSRGIRQAFPFGTQLYRKISSQ